jgi:hypothetical protein
LQVLVGIHIRAVIEKPFNIGFGRGEAEVKGVDIDMPMSDCHMERWTVRLKLGVGLSIPGLIQLPNPVLVQVQLLTARLQCTLQGSQEATLRCPEKTGRILLSDVVDV